MKTIKQLTLASTMGLLILSSASVAAKQGHIKVTSQAQKIITVRDAQGQAIKKYIPAKKVLPGEVVRYTNTLENVSMVSADDIGIVNPIPKNTVYIPNTASGNNFNIIYSVDGGKHWGTPATLKVRGTDGKLHAAKPADYTHISWKYKSSLQPKEKRSVSFQARLR